LQGHELEVLIPLVVETVLNDEDAMREGRAQIRGRHVNAVSLFTAVNALAGADAEFLDELVIALEAIK
jgi:hypothetical protein